MIEISTSILGVDRENIINTIYDLEKAKTNYFHIDVMDGEFVKNNTNDKMLEFCEYLNNITTTPLDVHLMVSDIKNYIDGYNIFNPNAITFHYEACKNKKEVYDIINYIKEKGCRVGISIKPNTPVKDIYEFLPFIHLVLIMTVEPGEGGQKLLSETKTKIKQLKEYIEKNKIEIDISADGGINVDNSKEIIEAGANIIVSGSGILKTENYEETIKKMKNIN